MSRTRHRSGRLLLASAFAWLAAQSVRAGDVEIAPFVGFQYGGALGCCGSGRRAALEAGLQYGAVVDVPFAERFSVELLFSRQETDLASAPRIGFAVERYMAGLREEKDVGRFRFLGVFLLGLTRLVPDGFGSEARFTLAAGLGLRTSLSRRLGVRADARVYYAVVTSGGGFACVNGSCLFLFGGSGLWQGDLTAALVLTL